MNNEKSNESNKLATVVISGNSLQVHDSVDKPLFKITKVSNSGCCGSRSHLSSQQAQQSGQESSITAGS